MRLASFSWAAVGVDDEGAMVVVVIGDVFDCGAGAFVVVLVVIVVIVWVWAGATATGAAAVTCVGFGCVGNEDVAFFTGNSFESENELDINKVNNNKKDKSICCWRLLVILVC